MKREKFLKVAVLAMALSGTGLLLFSQRPSEVRTLLTRLEADRVKDQAQLLSIEPSLLIHAWSHHLKHPLDQT